MIAALPRSIPRFGIAAALLASLTACGGGASEEEEASATVAVRTALVVAQDFAEVVSAIGQVTPRPGHLAAIGAPAPTRVTDIRVSAGQRVAKGAVLVVLESAVFESAERSARAAALAARQNAERSRRLVESGILPRRELEQAEAALATAEADLVVAQRNRELGEVRAPFDGVITRVGAVLGAAVDVGEVLVEVADPAAVDVVFAMPPADAARLHVGAAVALRAGEGQGGDTLGRGSVADIGGTVDADTRSVGVRVLASGLHRPLRIGETVFGELTVAVARGALVVPAEALVPEGDGFKVFVVDSANVAHARAVEVGGRRAGLVRLRAGVAVGERIVTYGAFGIDDGATVAPPRP